MCGLFGFIGTGPVDPDRLCRCAEMARRRGPHSIGAWIDGERQVGFGKDVARTLASIVRAAVERSATCVVGHCRLAPDDSWLKARNAQPLDFCFGAVAHNGNLPRYRALAAQYRLPLETEVDSEILGRLVEEGHANDLPHAFARVDPGTPVALLGAHRGVLLAFRRRHPLSVESRPEGTYLASDPRFGEPLSSEIWHTFGAAGPLAPRN